MPGRAIIPYTCSRCATALLRREARSSFGAYTNSRWNRHYSNAANTQNPEDDNKPSKKDADSATPKPGDMSRRLEEATEEALLTGGRAGRRAVEDAGFSEELKERLFAKVKDAEFRSEYASAFAEAEMPSSAGPVSRFAAASQPWTGEESTEDAVLRMLNDAHKPLSRDLRGKPKLPDLQPVDFRLRREAAASPGQRAASAREKAGAYTDLGLSENALDEKQKEARRREFRERFRPEARAVPNTLTGLASLANERIENAIARGQFKNIPRGKGIERDKRADNPFVDTTEYIMNKMIQRQDLVPPWIEKQQELLKTAHTFRTRLRNDWKRHAARIIASKGGSLQDQMRKARRYALAEEAHNPRKRNVEQISIPTSSTEDPVMAKIHQQLEAELVAESRMEDSGLSAQPQDGPPETETTAATPGSSSSSSQDLSPHEPQQPQQEPLSLPFRDPDWLEAEKSYMELAISNLNTITRSYNLMAPELAKKPYFNLERELNNCYADVAPQIAEAIKDRAARPSASPLGTSGKESKTILDRFGRGGHTAKVYESKAPHYGLREMWRDLFKRDDKR
ncbi:hypothetical protein PGQ11_008523 [Apiospora arundinis]|uniref:DnaJ homologue subfamily C member 28 conserved domain-containing protein n=1 Tax=Apiospora arundinis TaxID=335852 RepID=A0ABR2IG72_9PEZI